MRNTSDKIKTLRVYYKGYTLMCKQQHIKPKPYDQFSLRDHDELKKEIRNHN